MGNATTASEKTSGPDQPLCEPKPQRRRVNWATINFFLDLSLLWVSVVVQFIFPPGPIAQGWTLWGWNYVAFSRLQFGLLALLALGVLVHVMLHWSWICGVVQRLLRPQQRPARPLDDGTRTLYGVALLIVLFHLLGAGIGAAWLLVVAP